MAKCYLILTKCGSCKHKNWNLQMSTKKQITLIELTQNLKRSGIAMLAFDIYAYDESSFWIR